ncbi:MAG: hypothetical protein WD055_01115 [Candidatus Dependentiae bacterium]
MKSKKYLLSIICVFSGFFAQANQVKLSYAQQSPIRRDRQMQNVHEIMHFDEELDFDLDEQEIDVTQLVPVWAKFANKLAAPFFVLYNKMSHWWQEHLKKNENIQRF